MNNEFNELEQARKAAKDIGSGAKTLASMAFGKVVSSIQDVHNQLKNPLSLKEQAARTVQAKAARKVRSHKVRYLSNRIVGGLLSNTVGLTANILRGGLEGTIGYLDKTTKALANAATSAPAPKTASQDNSDDNDD